MSRWAIAVALALVAFPIYLLITWRMIGLRVEHLVIAAAFLALFMIGPKTARFAVLALPSQCLGPVDTHTFFGSADAGCAEYEPGRALR